ncbi:ABC transporter permease [Ensifer sp. YR511]|uniref:ABC transporter permease n=1 Tax=Ensifer sp. YR511 TaxID=1855294 RepID=UPI000887FCBD|nr:ABC transporter permease subunit [Ensifer sp. YR511]SDN03870.1 ABC-type transport system involved in multi-copper enzyme maturation, permease component [Ensifer sp. YR511]
MEHVRPPSFRKSPEPVGIARLLWLLARREAIAKLSSFWFFLVASVVCLTAFLYGFGFERTFETETVLVTSDPLAALNMAVIAFLGLVLGLRLSTCLSGEREHRTLEVLLVGPVPWSAVILSKFLAELGVLAALVAIYGLYLLIAQPLGGGVIGVGDAASLLSTLLFVLPVMAVGLLVSAWARSVRGAVVLYLALIVLLVAFEGALGALKTMPSEDMSLASLFLRAGLDTVAPVIQLVSPVSQLASMVERMFTQDPVRVKDAVAAVVLCAVMLAAAPVVARLRGAQG